MKKSETQEVIQRGAKVNPHHREHGKDGTENYKNQFTQREGDQSQPTDSSRDTGGCQFAGMAQNSPRSCAGQQADPPDWQLLWLHIRKRGRKSPAASSQSFLHMP
jgi:hypothetical protein